jgi:hypothetical protein
MLLEAETNKYCPGGNDIGAISNLIIWVLNFFFECVSDVMGRCTLWYRVLLLTSAVQAETTLITEMIWGVGGRGSNIGIYVNVNRRYYTICEV